MALTIVGPAAAGSLIFGGSSAAYDITAAAVIKAAPGTLATLTVQTAGSGGALVLNDCLLVANAAITNQIVNLPSASLTTGTILTLLNWPCLTGIVISAVPTGSVLSLAFS